MNENERSEEQIYQNAMLLASGGLYRDAADAFARIPGYRDAAEQQALNEERFEAAQKDAIYADADRAAANANVKSQQKAIAIFQRIPGWRDADARIAQAQARIEELIRKEREDREEAIHLAKEQQAKKAKRKKRLIRAAILSAAAIVTGLVAAFLFQTYVMPEIRYRQATAQIESGDSEAAYRILHELNHKDSSRLVFDIAKARLGTAEVGSTVLFGSYPQKHITSKDKDNIEWLVLAKDGSKRLLITRYALDCLPFMRYDQEHIAVTWGTSLVRSWLNSEFCTTAFDAGEQRFLQRTRVRADDLEDHDGGNSQDTMDLVFLLSVSEAKTYFPDSAERKCNATQFAVEFGAYQSSIGKTCMWWLRTTAESQISEELDDGGGYTGERIACVGTSGEIIEIGHGIYNRGYAVRPVIWIDLDTEWSKTLSFQK